MSDLPLANLNGQILPLSEVRISPLDRGFLLGDAIYEVLRVYGGKAFLADEHFQRLARSLAAIRLTGVDCERLCRRMNGTLAASGVREGMVYIQVTRGSAPRKHAFPKDTTPLELLWIQEFVDPYVEGRQRGIAVITQPDLRWQRCDIKTTSLLGNVLAMQAAVEAGCSEALLYLPDGTLTEGTHTNLFGVVAGTLITQPLQANILPGCTRGLIFRIAAKAGISIEQRPLKRDQLDEVSELFVSGTTSEVLPVVSLDARRIGDGQPGLITRRLQRAYAEVVQGFTTGERGASAPC
jgi:D-alanine transaminase